MPKPNRVGPDSQIVAVSNRGTMMGNRGRLHRSDGSLVTDKWRSKAWICCELEFKNRKREVMAANSYTELFFLDEAAALSAGHRPCAECRRNDFVRFKSALRDCYGELKAKEIDEILHRERLAAHWGGSKNVVDISQLPDGAFVDIGFPVLIWQGMFYTYTWDGYVFFDSIPLVGRLMTPPIICEAMRNGYVPRVHSSLNSKKV